MGRFARMCIHAHAPASGQNLTGVGETVIARFLLRALPEGVAWHGLAIGPEIESLVAHVQLPVSLNVAVPRRQLQYRAGRYCAMRALESVDRRFAGSTIGREPSGAPRWPKGIVGSITHTDDVVWAAAALAAEIAAIGIDTERILSERRARNVGQVLASSVEIAPVCDAGLSWLEALTLVFSAKESIFKCLYADVGRTFGFHDVRLDGIDRDQGTFFARVVNALSQEYPTDTRLVGRFEFEGEWVRTAVALKPKSPVVQ